MPIYTIEATVDCLGIYMVDADSEDEARKMFEQASPYVDFCHYSEEMPGMIRNVREEPE